MVAKKVLISGKVQGVSFRFHAHEVAHQLGLNGWVKNLNDGRVELIVAGPQKAVDSMIEWARKGPPLAKVEDIVIQECKENITPEPFFVKRDGGN